MAFSFGPTSAPAPGTAFSFSGTPAPTPAPAGAFGAPAAPAGAFGAPAAATPAPSAFGFGSTPAQAPTPGAFGSTTNTPAPGGFGGLGPALAPSGFGGGFGSPAPAPSTGFGFGAAPGAPATGTAFSFSSPAPAPGGFSSTFGASPAPGFGAQTQQQQMMQPLTGSTPYAELPQEFKKAIDTIHDLMMKHQRTMANLQTMAPQLLLKPTDAADVAAGSSSPSSQTSLAVTIRQLQQKISALESETVLQAQVDHYKEQYETLLKQSVYYGKWPIENLAQRRGIHLRPASTKDTSTNSKDSKSVQAQMQEIFDRSMTQVDRLERMPSPYLWQTLEDMEKRLEALHQKTGMVQQQLLRSHRGGNQPEDIASTVQIQHQAICRVIERMSRLHAQVDQLRQYYHLTEKGENVLVKAEYAEQDRQRQLEDRIRMQYVQATSAVATAGQQPSGLGAAPGPFGAAPATGAFGAPAPTTGSLFGSTPAPVAGGSNLFGNTPGPSGGLFGNTTPGAAPAAPVAPAPSIFGATPAPAAGAPAPGAPAPGAPLFGAAPAPSTGFGFVSTSSTPKSKNKSRSNSRLRKT